MSELIKQKEKQAITKERLLLAHNIVLALNCSAGFYTLLEGQNHPEIQEIIIYLSLIFNTFLNVKLQADRHKIVKEIEFDKLTQPAVRRYGRVFRERY